MPASRPARRSRTAKPRSAILHLNLYRDCFKAVLAGTKTVEYRKDTDFWRRRLVGREYNEIHFRNGYSADAPFMRVECQGISLKGSGADRRFAIRLGRVLETKNWK